MIAVAFALEFESVCFCARHDPRLRVGVWFLGAMGAAAALSVKRMLIDTVPDLLISAGFAGSLQDGLRVGDLVLGQNQSDPKVVAALSLSERWHTGCVATAEEILERAEDKKSLGEKTGCLAGDLETARIVEVCAQFGVPVLSVRCISDAVEDDLPVPAQILLDARTGRPNPLALFRYLIRHPASVSGFNKLLKNARIAQSELARGLEEILPQLVRMA